MGPAIYRPARLSFGLLEKLIFLAISPELGINHQTGRGRAGRLISDFKPQRMHSRCDVGNYKSLGRVRWPEAITRRADRGGDKSCVEETPHRIVGGKPAYYPGRAGNGAFGNTELQGVIVNAGRDIAARFRVSDRLNPPCRSYRRHPAGKWRRGEGWASIYAPMRINEALARIEVDRGIFTEAFAAWQR